MNERKLSAALLASMDPRQSEGKLCTGGGGELIPGLEDSFPIRLLT